jgi:hypothetical protein
MEDLRLLAVQRAVVELSAVAGAASRARALEGLIDEIATAQGDEKLVLQEAIDLIKDGRMLADATALGGWIRGS